MDTQTNSLNRVLQTLGKGKFFETTYECPELKSNEIKVRAVYTGICRSDIDMMLGSFGPLPLHMQGHEGLGQVLEIGSDVEDVQIGDYVATRGEPAYADVYTVKNREYVLVPEAHPRYIIEPVACGINLINQPFKELVKRSGPNSKLLIIGSGFLSWVAYHAIKHMNLQFNIDVVGSHNSDIWETTTKLLPATTQFSTYDVVIDLGSSSMVFDKSIFNNEGLLIFGAQKTVTTDFSNLLWKACTIVFTSPRTLGFYDCMHEAVYLIQTGKLNVDKFWTKGYNRDTEWQQAFLDGVNRPQNYSRGYLNWL